MGTNEEAEGLGDDFFDQIMYVPPPPPYSSAAAILGGSGGARFGGGGFRGLGMLPLGLNLQQQEGFTTCTATTTTTTTTTTVDAFPSSSSSPILMNMNIARDSVHLSSTSPLPDFEQLQLQSICPHAPAPAPAPAPSPPHPQLHQQFRGQPTPRVFSTAPNAPTMRPRVRARRGQATDPHSIAERLRRERIAERIKALQELVPSANMTDRAAMLDEIVDYVKFLRLQVKVLSMSRLGGAGAVAQLVSDVSLLSIKEEGIEGGSRTNQQAWEKWSTDGTEEEVAKLMEEDIGAAMQFLQSKSLCIMPISLANTIFRTQPPDASSLVKPESNTNL